MNTPAFLSFFLSRSSACGWIWRGAAAFVFLSATFAHAADSQFLFDANGNLLVQSVEIIAPPQIIGQPQNRVIAPGDSASFFVVAADTRALTNQ